MSVYALLFAAVEESQIYDENGEPIDLINWLALLNRNIILDSDLTNVAMETISWSHVKTVLAELERVM